jgi:hypothetical protein
VAVAAGAAAVALVGIVTAVQISVLTSLDETVYKLSAVTYANDPFAVITGDPVARGTARLYSLLVAPLFAVLEGDQAVRAARGLNAVLWSLTAWPVYVLARRFAASPARAGVAAVLAVAVPWMTLSTILFSEALAYLLFAAALVAMARALEEPSPRRDLVVLVALGALVTVRMQFVVLPVAWLAVAVWAARRRGGGGLRGTARRLAAAHPFLLAAIGLVLLAVLGLAASGALATQVDRFGGPYSALQDRTSLPRDAGIALLSEVALLSLGVGLVPAVLAAAWFGRAFGGGAGEDARRFAVLAAALVGILFATTVWAQGGWLDVRTEERYYIYAVPLLWIGAVAALDLPGLTAGRVFVGGAVLSALLFLVPIVVPPTGEQMFLGTVSGVIVDAAPDADKELRELLSVDLGVTRNDFLGWIALAVALVAALLWRRAPRLALVPAVALQLGIVLYALSAVHGHVTGVPGVLTDTRFAALGWVDRALPGGAEAVQAENGAEGREAGALNTAFWNDQVRSRVALEEHFPWIPPFPADTLPRAAARPRPDLSLGAALPSPFVIADPASPRWQLEGDALARSPDGRLELVEAGEAPRLRWLARGVELDGHVVRPVELLAPAGRRVVVVVEPPAGTAAAAARFRLGRERRLVETSAGRQELTFSTCGAAGPVAGAIDVVRAAQIGGERHSAALLRSVRVEPCA